MNRNLSLATALVAGLLTTTATAPLALAQAAPAAAPAAAPVAPQAIPAKIALVAFEQAVFATNEGQVAAQGVAKKYEPKKAQIETLAAEVDSLKKQLQAAPATLSDEERASRLRSIDTKEKQLNRDAEDAQTAYNTDLQEALGKVAQKLSVTMKQYAQSNGFTLLLDVSNQNSTVLWAQQSTEITQAVVDAYNKTSGVAAPPPMAPSPAARPRSAAPAAAHPAGK
ncbi:OmpH family outer membrane protein [Granulicella sp. WH15]|uniref:OmpH family outer membrane protein n=1 Tax=Granulicella sp. WH15 TaxID=2602070 RepID=UPI00136780FC|nr:OmpH family outer membrane protein [Granulicella sp. WH15]QHN05008.1 OmpH family outer membrane protein [Granulicella sp. WH15]